MEKRSFIKEEPRVTIRKNLLIGLVAALGVSLLALVFFLGRESARNGSSFRERNLVSPGHSSAVFFGDESVPGDSVLERENRSSSASDGDEFSSGDSFSGQEVEAVRSYFDAVARIQPDQMGGDASVMANELLSTLTLGDSSGLDNLILQSKTVRDKLAAMSPPQPCTRYHQLMMASMEDGLELMQSLKNAVIESDMDALTSLATKGYLLQSRSEELSREENAVRRRFGLPR